MEIEIHELMESIDILNKNINSLNTNNSIKVLLQNEINVIEIKEFKMDYDYDLEKWGIVPDGKNFYIAMYKSRERCLKEFRKIIQSLINHDLIVVMEKDL